MSGDMMCCPLGGGGDFDGPEAWRSIYRTARKIHSCIECGEEIKPGQIYRYESGIWDGRADSHKTCKPCYLVREHFSCDGYIFEMLWEDMQNNFFPNMVAGGECMHGLDPIGKQKLFDEYNEWLPSNADERKWWQNQDELAHQARELIEKQKAQS